MLLAPFALLLVPSQVWEKPITPGLVYREEVDSGTPRVFHILRFRPGKGVRATSELAGGTVFANDVTKGRATVSEMVKRSSAIAGINGDYFPYTGDPLGLMIHEGELASLPYVVPATNVTRSAMLWNDKSAMFSNSFSYTATVKVGTGDPLPIDGLNQACGLNQMCLNRGVAGLCLAKNPSIEIVIDNVTQTSLGGAVQAVVRQVLRDQGGMQIPDGAAVLVATGDKIGSLDSLKPGNSVQLQWKLNSIAFKGTEAIGGGPMLVQDGQVAMDAAQEGFRADFSNNHHPRTAIGRRADGELWFVVVDGRQTMSDGIPLTELAEWFLAHGCLDAMNLDGGGSSTLNIAGLLLNRPSDGAEHAVANGVIFYSDAAKTDSSDELEIHLSGVVKLGALATATLLTKGGRTLQNREVIWTCQGAAWIDQAGILHPLAEGEAIISAWSHGSATKTTVKIESSDRIGASWPNSGNRPAF